MLARRFFKIHLLAEAVAGGGNNGRQ
jgi:hypothetical protein